MTGRWIDVVAVMEVADAEVFKRILERHLSGLDVTYCNSGGMDTAALAVLHLEMRNDGVLSRLEEALDAECSSFTGQRPALIPV